MSPRVSVVIPVFNRATAVRQAITSVLAQTFGDFEVIVVDDGSTDDISAAVACFRDPRIRLLRHAKNMGGSAARNTGIRNSTAEFVAFLDSDDEWFPTKLEKQVQVLERCPDDVAFVYTGSEAVYPDGSLHKSYARHYADLHRVLLTTNVVGESSVGMVRRSALLEVDGFDEALPAAQDADLWLRLSERYGAEVLPEPLVRVTKRNAPDRISTNPQGTIRGRELFLEKHADKMSQHGVATRFLRDLGWLYLRAGRDSAAARRCYAKALALNPLSPKTCVLLVMTCLPMSWLDALASWKHRTVTFRTRPLLRGEGHPGRLP